MLSGVVQVTAVVVVVFLALDQASSQPTPAYAETSAIDPHPLLTPDLCPCLVPGAWCMVLVELFTAPSLYRSRTTVLRCIRSPVPSSCLPPLSPSHASPCAPPRCFPVPPLMPASPHAPQPRGALPSWELPNLPVLFGAILYAFEGITLVLPIESQVRVRVSLQSPCHASELPAMAL